MLLVHSSRRRTAAVCVLLAISSACAAPIEESTPGGTSAEAEAALAPRGTLVDRGPVELAPADAVAAPVIPLDGPDPRADQAFDPAISVIDLARGRTYALQLDPGVRDLAAVLPVGDDGDVTPLPEARTVESADGLVDKGWALGIDGRVPWGIGDGSLTANSFPHRTVGRVTSGCSGAMVHCPSNATQCFYMTAAHCLFSGSGAALTANFVPRKHGNTTPFGTWTAQLYFHYTAFKNNECFKAANAFDSCHQYDIAVVRVGKCASCTSPGSIGWGSIDADRLESLEYTDSKVHMGYPGCGTAGAPTNCETDVVYSDSYIGDHASYRKKDGDGWNRLVNVSNAMSNGHSGAPLYMHSGNIEYAVVVADRCTGSACVNDYHPNIIRRITPEWFGMMKGFMGLP